MSPFPRLALAAALLLALASGTLRAEDPAPPPEKNTDRFAEWAKSEIARLEAEVDRLKAQVAELSKQAAPALDQAREKMGAAAGKFEEHRPAIESAAASLWERTKAAFVAFADDVRAVFNREKAPPPESE